MDTERKVIALVGHSYMKRLAIFCRTNEGRLNLGFDVNQYAGVTVLVRQGRAFSRSFVSTLRQPEVCGAAVIFIHLGENDYNTSTSPQALAMELYSAVSGHLVMYGTHAKVIIAELLPVPRNDQRWTDGVNRLLRILVDRGDSRIRLWSFGSTLKRRRAFSYDGVHITRSYMVDYWKAVRQAVVTGLIDP
jgi:hypothetical protein